ncbi:MAG: hypothetical protein QM523_10240 [Candidatus Pacebacteria bacterium]|nr:hypothetical protein [Candidatus Paceibacterota bacterium]
MDNRIDNFSTADKETIMKRDMNKCVVCGSGFAEGYNLYIDNVKPKAFGGKATVENAQILCSRHFNFKNAFVKYYQKDKC